MKIFVDICVVCDIIEAKKISVAVGFDTVKSEGSSVKLRRNRHYRD